MIKKNGKKKNTGSRNRTHTEGFGDLSSTFKLCPYDMEGEGFEPPNPKERIYSPPRLATSLPFRRDTHLDGGYFNLPHFFADWLVWITIVCVNQAVRAVFSAIDDAHTSRIFIDKYEEVVSKKVHLDGSVLSRHDLDI